jgi:hypothetical protein
VDIFIITDMNTGYRFDASLNLKQTLYLGPLGDFTEVTCNGFHSNLLVYVDKKGLRDPQFFHENIYDSKVHHGGHCRRGSTFVGSD